MGVRGRKRASWRARLYRLQPDQSTPRLAGPRRSDRARTVLTLAQDEAQRFNHSYIGTEHLLLGLLRVDDCMATRVLRNLWAELPKVRTAVEFIIGRGDLPIVG